MTRILSLDDDPEMLELTRMVIEYSGYESITTSNSRAALDILRTQPVDLLTQDMLRPDIDGETLCKIIHADEGLRRSPILIISAFSEGGKRMVNAGHADAYLSKPWSPIEMLDALENVLQKRSILLAPEETRNLARQRWKRKGMSPPPSR